jgi:hypothetical protein
MTPAHALAEPFGALPAVDALASSALDQMVALVDARRIPVDLRVDWATFLQRFGQARSRSASGLAVVVIEAPETLAREALRWSEHLRRVDCVIWADMHLPAKAKGLAASLASALAVEICGWRLDLAQQLVRASRSDLADPIGWLARRPEVAIFEAHQIDDAPFGCPLALLKQDVAGLRRRIWKAHLSTLFPVLEDSRIELVQKYRGQLRIDEHLLKFGIRDLDEIELGGLRWQLSGRIGQAERLRLDRLVSIRNSLAHRQPADPEDVRQLFTM